MSEYSEIINAAGPMLGVVVGALLAGLVTYINNKNHVRLVELTEQKKRNIARVEELYEILNSLNFYSSTLTIEIASSIKEERQLSSDGIKRVSTDRLILLVSLYFQSLKDDAEAIKSHFSKMTEVIMRFYLQPNMSFEESKRNLSEASEISKSINSSIVDMQKKLCNESRKINEVV